MKKLLLLIICIVIFGCSKNNGSTKNNPPVQASIYGKWYLTIDTALTYNNGILVQTIVHGYSSNNDKNYIQFNKDGTGSTAFVGDTVSINYQLSGDTVIYAGRTKVGFIKQLTTSQLTLYYDVSGVVNSVNQRIITIDHFRR